VPRRRGGPIVDWINHRASLRISGVVLDCPAEDRGCWDVRHLPVAPGGPRSTTLDRCEHPTDGAVYGAVPVALYLLIALLAAGRGFSRRPRYCPGDQWRYPSSWCSANPKGSGMPEPPRATSTRTRPTGRTPWRRDAGGGGAHGSW
jgi:hypothetical protein